MTRAYLSEAPIGQAPALNHHPLQIGHTLIGIFDKNISSSHNLQKMEKWNLKILVWNIKGF
jgi:hypothetical protein